MNMNYKDLKVGDRVKPTSISKYRGTIGTVESIDSNFINVDFDNGKYHSWEKCEYGQYFQKHYDLPDFNSELEKILDI